MVDKSAIAIQLSTVTHNLQISTNSYGYL